MSNEDLINKVVGKYEGLGLSPQQEKGMEFLDNFVRGTKRTATLSGYAGTGKTFLLHHFLKSYNRNVCVTAPTHKAVRVIEQLINSKGRTLHSLLGLRPNVNLDNFNIDNVKFDLLGKEQMPLYNLVITDECSQISSGLKIMMETVAERSNTKILYVGDSAQLPPVGERISATFLNPNQYELTDIMRQEKGNPLLKLLGILRTDIKNNTSIFVNTVLNHREEINEKGEGYVALNRDDFKTKMNEYFSNDKFLTNINFCRYTARTNENVREWNKWIRDKTIEHKGIVTIDDLFTGYKTILDEFISPIITNSEDYIVNQIEERISQDGFKTFNLILKDVFTGKLTPQVSVVDYTDASFVNYIRKVSALHGVAINANLSNRNKAWKNYYEFKDQHLTLFEFPIKVDGRKTGTVTRDLDYGYGLTTHKIQGSTYENIFVNLVNMIYYNYDGRKVEIKDNTKNPYAIEFRNKLLYVALSRAKKKVIMYL